MNSVNIDTFMSGPVARYTATLKRLTDKIDPGSLRVDETLYRELEQETECCLAGCAELQRCLGADSPELASARHRFQQAIRPWYEQSPLMRHAQEKPYGYAGDYEMLISIYENRRLGRGIGAYLDHYFLNTELGRAVPIRLRDIQMFLLKEAERREGEIQVLDVACGPAREYSHGFFLPTHCTYEVTLIDQDESALNYVRQQVMPYVPANVHMHPIRHNALRMMSGSSNRRHFGEVDILYSVGLCDYIPDNILVKLLRGWRETLAPGGVLYVAFKDCLRYNPLRYQWLVDWHFFSRTEQDCRILFEQAGYDPECIEMSRDHDLGAIMNFVYRIPEVKPVDCQGEELIAAHNEHRL